MCLPVVAAPAYDAQVRPRFFLAATLARSEPRALLLVRRARHNRQTVSAHHSLSARSLAQRFGLRGRVAGDALRTIYHGLGDQPSGLGEESTSSHAAWQAIGAQLGIAAPLEPGRLRRMLEAYYAAVIVAVTESLVAHSGGTLAASDDSPWLWETADRLRAAAGDFAPPDAADDPARGVDLFQQFYQALFPQRIRHALGEYYTPGWLAEFVLRESGWDGAPAHRLLDPTCGSGAFLLRALSEVRARWERLGRQTPAAELLRRVRTSVVGYDVNWLAVLTARANYLLAVRDWLGAEEPRAMPVERRDVILEQPVAAGGFDFVVGNPPWIAWDHLPSDYRQATMPLWQQYGLFTLSAAAARHGGAKKDLSMLLTYACADRYLKDGGRLGFVITQTAFQSHASGDGFRRFQLGAEGPPLAVLRVHDLVAVRPFAGAANWTSVLILEKGRPTRYPVAYVKWVPTDSTRRSAVGRVPAVEQHYEARPAEPDRPGSPWMLVPQGLAGLERLAGPSDYAAHLGANTGGANGVYWLEVRGCEPDGLRVRNVVDRGKHAVTCREQTIEPELVYPLIRWGDVDRWRAAPSAHLLLAQDPTTRRGVDEAWMRARLPRSYAYLSEFRPLLEARAAFRRYQSEGPFYAMYNVGPYTVAPWKVVWRRMDRRLRAAVIGQCEVPGAGWRSIVPQETCVVVATQSAEEAHYLCAVVNSPLSAFLARSSSVDGGKGFGTPGMLDYLNLRRFEPANRLHRELAACGLRAHTAAASGGDLDPIEAELERLTATLAGLSAEQSRQMREAGAPATGRRTGRT